MIIQSQNVRKVLEATLKPVHIDYLSFDSSPLQSSILLSATNGAVLSYAASTSSTSNEMHSINNLKMMGLLVRDKWSEDEQEQRLQSRYTHSVTLDKETATTNIYAYEIEDLHACTAQIPQSSLLLLFIADVEFPYGLLVMKMKGALEAFKDMYGYQLS